MDLKETTMDLHLAVLKNDMPSVKRLIEWHKADLNAENEHGITPLAYCMNVRRLSILKFLTKNGANVKVKGLVYPTLIHEACTHRPAKDIVEPLIDAGADVNVKTQFGATPLMLALMFKQPLYFLRYLVSVGADPNTADLEGKTALHYAARHCTWDEIEYVASISADINAVDVYGRTPLHWLALRMDCESDAYYGLIRLGANQFVGDAEGNSSEYFYRKPD